MPYTVKKYPRSAIHGRALTHSKNPIHVCEGDRRRKPLAFHLCSDYAGAMAKAKRQYVCQNCGSVTYRWQGQCADCGEWNTLVEEAAETVFSAKHDLSKGGRTITLETLDANSPMPERMLCGIAEFDRALGGGFVAGSATLIGGDPGIGKSTLLLQAAATARAGGQVGRLYQRRGSRGAGAAARSAARARQCAGRARRGDVGARHLDDARPADRRFARDRFDPDDA